MHLEDMPVRILPDLSRPEQPALVRFLQDAFYPYRRFNIASLPDVMDRVTVIDGQPYLLTGKVRLRTGIAFPPAVPGRPDNHRIICKTVNHSNVVNGAGIVSVLPFQYGPDDLTGILARQRFTSPKSVKDKVGRAVVTWFDRSCIQGVVNRPCSEALIISQPFAVLLKYLRIAA